MGKIYIAYGSNMNLKQMKNRCPKAKKIGISLLNGYKLLIPRVATIAPIKDAFVPVVLWEITEACERALDIYEGYPRLYRKEQVKVLTEKGVEVFGMAYVLNEPYCNYSLKPTEEYLNIIREGYLENKIDTNCIDIFRKEG